MKLLTNKKKFNSCLVTYAYKGCEKYLHRFKKTIHSQKYKNFEDLEIKKVMKKNPISVDKDMLAATALSIMNSKKITSLCVHNGKERKKTIGLVHMHNILKSNIN